MREDLSLLLSMHYSYVERFRHVCHYSPHYFATWKPVRQQFWGQIVTTFFEGFCFFVSRCILDAADDPRPMRHPTFVANNLQVLNLADVAGL